jgi:hypothetical protein
MAHASLALALFAHAVRADISVGGARLGAGPSDGAVRGSGAARTAWPRAMVCNRYSRLRVYAETNDEVRGWWWRSADGSVSVPLVDDREAPGSEVLAQLIAVEPRSASDKPIRSSKVVSFSLECEGGGSVRWWCSDGECTTSVVVPFTQNLAVEEKPVIRSNPTEEERDLRHLLGRARTDLVAICASGHCSSEIRRLDQSAAALMRARWTRRWSSFPNRCDDYTDGKNAVRRRCGAWAVEISDGRTNAEYMPGIRDTWQPNIELLPRQRGLIHISSGWLEIRGAALEVLP